MKLKYFAIFAFLLLLVCSANAIYAAADDSVLELDQNGDIISLEEAEPISAEDAELISASQEETILTETADTASSNEATPKTVSSASAAKKFKNDIKNKEKTVNLTGDIQISEPFQINYNVVIDGQGHTIDAQKKCTIFRFNGATVTIKNLILKNAKGTDKRGAIFAFNTNLNVRNCTFKYNKATENGGAIYLFNGKLTIDKSTFSNNAGKLRGGAICTYSAKVTITNSIFENNKIENSNKKGYGGAFWSNKGTSSMKNTSFKNNYCLSKALKSHGKATKYQFSGGAVYYSEGSKHYLTACKFISNKATNAAGAVYGLKCKYLKMNKCIFKYNKAGYEDGGAICFNGKKIVMTNSNFTKNHAYEDGGVMDSFSVNKNKVKVTVTGCHFEENTAYKGAGVFWMGVKTVYTLKNNNFINNAAGMGGVLFSEDSTSKISKCLFQGNKAKNLPKWRVKNKSGGILKQYGGAILIQKRTLTISKCIFKKNSAASGGAIFRMGGKLKLSANKFSGNKAKSGKNVKK